MTSFSVVDAQSFTCCEAHWCVLRASWYLVNIITLVCPHKDAQPIMKRNRWGSINMPKKFKKYDKIWKKYAKYAKICRICKEICNIYEIYMQYIHAVYMQIRPRNMHNTHKKYAKNIQNICKTYAKHMQKMCSSHWCLTNMQQVQYALAEDAKNMQTICKKMPAANHASNMQNMHRGVTAWIQTAVSPRARCCRGDHSSIQAGTWGPLGALLMKSQVKQRLIL